MKKVTYGKGPFGGLRASKGELTIDKGQLTLHSQDQLEIKAALGKIIGNGIEFPFYILDPLFGHNIVNTQQVEDLK